MSTRGHDAEVAVVDFLVVVVLGLHDLVAGTKGPSEALDADLAGRVQRLLQFDIERAGTEAARGSAAAGERELRRVRGWRVRRALFASMFRSPTGICVS